MLKTSSGGPKPFWGMESLLSTLICFLFLILFFSTQGLAQEPATEPAPADDREVVTLESVVVTASKPETEMQTGDVDTELTPTFFSVINKDQFEGKMESVAEVIEKEAGVQVRHQGGLGGYSTVSLRGSSSDQVMIFMDGILLNDASGGGVNLSNIALADVEAIEVYRGVSPINFGKASIGGVINIRTLRTQKGLRGSVKAGYGSFYTRSLSGFINHKPGKGDYLVSVDYQASDNDFRFYNKRGTPANPSDDRWENRNNSQFEQYNVLGKFGYDFTDDFRIEFVNQLFLKDQGLPTWNNSPYANAGLDTRRNIATLKMTRNNLGPYHLNTSLRLDYSWKEEEYDDRQGQIGLGRQHSKYTTNRYGANLFLELPLEHQILSFTADARREEYSSKDLIAGADLPKSHRDYYSFGLQDNIFLLQDRLIVTPAVRYSIFDDHFKDSNNALTDPESSKTKGYFTPQLGIKVMPKEWLSLKANIAQYVREPSFFELFGDRGFFIGNDDLEAEKGLNFDVGFEVNWQSKKWWWLSRVSVYMAYFQSDITDAITYVYDSRGIGRAVNLGKARIYGVESGMTVDFLKYLRFVANATVQDPQNKSEVAAFRDKKLPGRFEKSYLGRLEARYKGFKVYGEYIREEDMYYDTANLLKARDKSLYNAGVSYLYRSWLFSLDAKNLSDEQYEDFSGYPLPGTSYNFTVKYSF